MPPLKNSRHEKFALALFEGNSVVDAYEIAGFKRNDGNGMRLKGNESIAARIRELKDAAASKVVVTKEQVLREYVKLAFSDPREIAKWGPHGVDLLDSAAITDDAAACIAEVIEKPTAQGGSVTGFKLHDKKGALDSLAKYFGMFVEKHEVEHKHTFADLVAGSMEEEKP